MRINNSIRLTVYTSRISVAVGKAYLLSGTSRFRSASGGRLGQAGMAFAESAQPRRAFPSSLRSFLWFAPRPRVDRPAVHREIPTTRVHDTGIHFFQQSWCGHASMELPLHAVYFNACMVDCESHLYAYCVHSGYSSVHTCKVHSMQTFWCKLVRRIRGHARLLLARPPPPPLSSSPPPPGAGWPAASAVS